MLWICYQISACSNKYLKEQALPVRDTLPIYAVRNPFSDNLLPILSGFIFLIT